MDSERASLWIIRLSMGLGGSFLAAAFAAEAYLRGGFFILFAAGVFLAVGLASRLFGKVGFGYYLLATVAWTVVLLVVGVPA